MRIYKYRSVNGAWKSYGYVTVKASNSASYSKYAGSVSLPYSGNGDFKPTRPPTRAMRRRTRVGGT